MQRESTASRFLFSRVFIALLLFLVAGTARAVNVPEQPVATYSIVAYDPETGDLGVAVQSKFFGVGAVVPFAKAGVGAIATQSYANTHYGTKGLAMMAKGFSAEGAVHELTKNDDARDVRQVGMVDAAGRPAAFTGEKCNDWAGHVVGDFFTVQGNILAGESVVEQMAAAFKSARKEQGTELADWLMAAVAAGEAAGGDRRGRQSAAMLVVRNKGGYGGQDDRYVDLRVDDNPQPIKELARLLALHKRFFRAEHNRRPAPGPIAADLMESEVNDFQRLGWPFFVAAIVGLAFLFVLATKDPAAPKLGVLNGRLTPCPRRMNCVSSDAFESEFRVEPILFAGSMAEAKTLLMETALKLPHTKLIAEEGNYFRFECRSAALRFVDDLEILFNEQEGQIHVRSGARCGFWDLGVNRRRVQLLRSMLPASYTDLPIPRTTGYVPEEDVKDAPAEKSEATTEPVGDATK